jgi:5'-AMP-activated protein kinase catalytic alpha subunit
MNLSSNITHCSPLRHYSLHETLGAGSFAKVKRATHLLTDQPIAIKILTHGKPGTFNDISRISREVHIMQQLHHPNIVQLYEVSIKQVVEEQDKTFLAMEYLKGGDLLKYVISQQRLQEPEAFRMFRQLVSGVGYLHGLGVSHRDLKPANLLLTARKDLKIADFGLSAEDSIKTLETRCGSPCFTAPEVINGTAYDGRKVDIWGLGIVLYIMLVGRLPFEDENKPGLFRKICAGRYILPSFVSQNARNLLKRMLVVEAKDRATLAEIQKHPWLAKTDQTSNCSKRKHTIDYSVLAEAQSLGFTHKELLEGLERNIKNPATATYHILLNKHLQENDTIELLRTNRTSSRRAETPLLGRRRKTFTRQTPEPVSSLSPLRSPKPLDRKETSFIRWKPSLRAISQSRGIITKRLLPDSQRPTVGFLRRRCYREPIAV